MGEEYKIEWNGKTLVGVESDKCGNCVFYSGGGACPQNDCYTLCSPRGNEFGKSLKFIEVIESGKPYKIIEVYEKETSEGTQYYKNVDGSNSHHYAVVDAIEIGDDVFLLENPKPIKITEFDPAEERHKLKQAALAKLTQSEREALGF